MNKESKKNGGKNNRISFKNDPTKQEYAIAVDRYFRSFPNKNTLFSVVSKDEERAACKKFENDRKSLENFLITHNIFLAVNLASHYSHMYTDYNELLSNAMFGLTEAARKFKTENNTRFNTYATHWILKYIKHPFYNDTYNKRIVANTSVYLDSSDCQKEKNDDNCCFGSFMNSIEPTFCHKIDSFESPSDKYINEIENTSKEKFIEMITESVHSSSLSSTDKMVYSKFFINGEKISDISKENGLSMMTIIKSKKRITEYISKNFSDLRKSI